MEEDQPNTVVVRDNTGILLVLLLFVFVTMVLLSVTLVRLGTLDRKVVALLPPRLVYPPPILAPPIQGGGVEFFYVR